MFVSKFSNGVDAKGRVSIPAAYRDRLGGGDVFLMPHLTLPCLEGGGADFVAAVMAAIEVMPSNSARRQALEEWVVAEIRQLSVDANGRVNLPEELVQQASLADRALFVGRGNRFQVWAPEAFELHRAESKARAVEGVGHLEIPSRVTPGEVRA